MLVTKNTSNGSWLVHSDRDDTTFLFATRKDYRKHMEQEWQSLDKKPHRVRKWEDAGAGYWELRERKMTLGAGPQEKYTVIELITEKDYFIRKLANTL